MNRVLDSRGAVSKALAKIKAAGGPDLDICALAQETGVSARWLHALDQGRVDIIVLDDLERLCRILGRSPNDILGYEPDE